MDILKGTRHKKWKSMIDAEKFLDDYLIKFIDLKLYLW
jgi:hypothetical protein